MNARVVVAGGLRQVARLASVRAQSFGASSLAGLVAAAAADGIALSEQQARSALARPLGAAFLDDDWFWLPARRNRLATVSYRILAVTSPLDVETIRAGVCRTYPNRKVALVPPAAVMHALYGAHPGFAIDTLSRVQAASPLDWTTELGKNDRIFVDVLRGSWTGVLDRASFQEACAARGMTARTFGASIGSSAVLDHPMADVWCLRGTRVSPITVAALRHAKGE